VYRRPFSWGKGASAHRLELDCVIWEKSQKKLLIYWYASTLDTDFVSRLFCRDYFVNKRNSNKTMPNCFRNTALSVEVSWLSVAWTQALSLLNGNWRSERQRAAKRGFSFAGRLRVTSSYFPRYPPNRSETLARMLSFGQLWAGQSQEIARNYLGILKNVFVFDFQLVLGYFRNKKHN